jgi:hypothetical protein
MTRTIHLGYFPWQIHFPSSHYSTIKHGFSYSTKRLPVRAFTIRGPLWSSSIFTSYQPWKKNNEHIYIKHYWVHYPNLCELQSLVFIWITSREPLTSMTTNLAIGTSSETYVCTCFGSLQPTYVCNQYIQYPVYTFWAIRVYPFHHILRSSATCNNILFCLSLSKLTTILS